MEVIGMMIGIAIGILMIAALLGLFSIFCWALWEMRYFIILVMIIYIIIAVVSKYSHADELRSEYCYTTMNVQNVVPSLAETLVSHEEKNLSVNHVQNAQQLAQLDKFF